MKKKNLPKEDMEIWDNYTRSPSDIYDKDNENLNDNKIHVRFKFDLHGFTLSEANQMVKKVVFSCVNKKYKEILFITGKGLHSTTDNNTYVSRDLSKLKYSVPEFINNNNELKNYVVSVSEASTKDGGAGAILIKLKNL